MSDDVSDDVSTDVTDQRRAECERLVVAAGHVSPRGSIHPCVRCGLKVRWADLRWVLLPGIPHPVPTHDCPNPYKPEATT